MVFVCGAQSRSGQALSARDILIRYAERHLPDFSFFRAEDAIKQLSANRSVDLLRIENELARYADCIIIVLESHGAIAELGAFANTPALAKLILAINDKAFRLSTSFITQGPLRTVASTSRFKSAIYTNLNCILDCMPQLEARLRAGVPKKGFHVDMSSASAFTGALPKYRLLFVADMVGLLSPATKEDIYEFFGVLYGARPKWQLDLELGMLEALGLVKYLDPFILRTANQVGQFFKYSRSDFAISRDRVLQRYRNVEPRRIDVLLEHSRS